VSAPSQVGTCIVGRSTQEEVAAYFPNAGDQSTIQKVVSTVKRAKEQNMSITSPSPYEDLPRSGRPELRTPRQRRVIVKIVTQDRAHREKEPFQAIADVYFKDIVPLMSITTFGNVMYEADRSRKKPGWKTPLTPKSRCPTLRTPPACQCCNHGLANVRRAHNVQSQNCRNHKALTTRSDTSRQEGL
jgi:hypothetical protein